MVSFEKLCVFAFQFRLCVGECLDRFVNVFAIIDADRPILEFLHRLLRGLAHFLRRTRFLDDSGAIRRDCSFPIHVVQRDDGALKCDLGRILRADFVQRGVRFRDCVCRKRLDGGRRLFQFGTVRIAFAFAAASRNASTVLN